MAACGVDKLKLEPHLEAVMEQEYPRFSDGDYARTDRRGSSPSLKPCREGCLIQVKTRAPPRC